MRGLCAINWGMKPRPLGALFLTALAITACHDSVGPTGPMSGRWKGTPSVYSPMDFTLTQTDTLIQGSGTLSAKVPEPMVVIGFVSSVSATPVALTFAVENVFPGVFLGTLSQDGKSVHGTFYLDGGASDTVTFLRQ